MDSWMVIAGLVVVAMLVQVTFTAAGRAKARKALATAQDMAELGDIAASSLHPYIDPQLCMGSGACVLACPEKDVLGLMQGRVHLVNPLGCVGHGACASACPVEAINLVFGTATRGVELPIVDAEFQTNRAGVYCVGELGGMGLIRNAVRQGVEVGQYIAASQRRGHGRELDAVVVGAGPAGVAATLQLLRESLRVILLEHEEFGGTITHYPRNKVVMTGPLDFPGYGRVSRRTMRKEELIDLFYSVRKKTGLVVRTGELVARLRQDQQGHWVVDSTSGGCIAANVVLALGRRGSPKKLGVPGEELAKVHYRLLEPEVFTSQHVLVVGGGNAAAESVIALVEGGKCASVTLSYRRDKLARLRGLVRERLEQYQASKQVRVLKPSNVVRIEPSQVVLEEPGKSPYALTNHEVIVQVGGTPPTQLLNTLGIQTVVKRGEA